MGIEVGIDVPLEAGGSGGSGGSQHGHSQPDSHTHHQELDLSRNSASEDEPSRGSVRVRGEPRGAESMGGAGDSVVKRLKAVTLRGSSADKATPTDNDHLELADGYGHGGGGSQPMEYTSLSLSLSGHTWAEDMSSLDRRTSVQRQGCV